MSEATQVQQLFPGGDFSWALRMRKADPLEFFAPQSPSGHLLRQKGAILNSHPERHVSQLEEGVTHLGKLHQALAAWGLEPGGHPQAESIARHIEPDFILMDQASQKLTAAAVCFPSSWDPSHWGGHAIHEIHAVVPRLNPQIGEMIARFLHELKPGKAFQRANWSFTRSAELNYHPALQRPVLDDTSGLEEIHLRLEHQLFTAIEGAVLMGIRIQPIALSSLTGDAKLWANLIRILDTMPENVARYKSLHGGKNRLIERMRSELPAT
ncbi:MAG: DUF3445 domain-containing protein [Akkermansiaceae bacterium]|nr:DUF3445 domain-containing protein [Akkermansiaceae bacterium]